MRIRSYPIARCCDCGHYFLAQDLTHDHATAVYTDSYFRGGRQRYVDYCAEGEQLRHRGRLYGALLKEYSKAGSVFDAGAAAGFILKGMHDAGWQGLGVEPNSSMVNYARHVNKVDVRIGSLEQWKKRDPFEAVTMIQVISHFYDLRKAMDVARGITKSGSLWLVETWDRESLSARSAGTNWHEFNPPSVVNWFSRDGLRYLGEQYGFEAIAQGRPKMRVTAASARCILSAKDDLLSKLGNAALAVLPDKTSLPYAGDDLFWMIFRRR